MTSLGLVRWLKTAENSTDYSLNATSYNMLFLPCTREQKYAAKQAIDSFFVRMGDVASAGLVFLATTYFALTASGFARFNIVLVGVWIAGFVSTPPDIISQAILTVVFALTMLPARDLRAPCIVGRRRLEPRCLRSGDRSGLFWCRQSIACLGWQHSARR